jgi:hypothetical protein
VQRRGAATGSHPEHRRRRDKNPKATLERLVDALSEPAGRMARRRAAEAVRRRAALGSRESREPAERVDAMRLLSARLAAVKDATPGTNR